MSWPPSELELRFRFVLTCLEMFESRNTNPDFTTHPLLPTGPFCPLSPAHLRSSVKITRTTAHCFKSTLTFIPARNSLAPQAFRDAAAVPSFSGTAVVTQNKAAVWTDSRYWVQAERQMDCGWELEKDGMRAHFVIICCGDRHGLLIRY